jgi:ankyrin repeat protein
LFHALSNGQKEVALFLLKNGADVANNPNGTTPLNFTQDKELVTILLEKGADANGDGSTTKTAPPLFAAIDNNAKDVMCMLIEHGADIEAVWQDVHALAADGFCHVPA